MANDDSFLDAILNPPTQDPGRNFSINDTLDSEASSASFSVPVGAFDFTGGAWKVARRASRRNTFTLSALGAIFFLVMGYGWYSSHEAEIVAKNTTILMNTSNTLGQQIDNALTGSSSGESLKTLVSSIQSAQTAVKSILSQEPQYVPILKSIQAAAGSSVTINSITFPTGAPSTASSTTALQLPGTSTSTTTGGPIVITGVASSYSALSAWSSSLTQNSYLTGTSTSFSQSSVVVGGAAGIQFTTNATLTSAGYTTNTNVYLSHLLIPRQLLAITEG
jgi:Tfp pilus assembly protein PilN